MKANLLLNCLGLNPDLTSKQPRPDSVSSPCRCRVLATLLLCLTLGVGNAWADVTDVITASDLTATSGSYTAFSNVSKSSNAVYAGKTALGNSVIQMNSSSPNGIISTTSGGTIKSVTIVWESHTTTGRTIDIYGKNSAYSASSELWNSTNAGVKVGSVSYDGSHATTTLQVYGDFQYIGLRSNSNALYVSSISITWTTPSNPTTFSLVTNASDLSAGDKIIILDTGGTYALSTTQNTNNRAGVAAAANNWSISGNIVTLGASSTVQVITLGASGSYKTLVTGTGFLRSAGSGTSYYLKTQSSIDTNGEWTISISNDEATITEHGTNTNNTIRFSSPNFGGYTSTAQTAIKIYKEFSCTPLGSINGSVSLTNEDCDPGELKATWKMTATTGIASQTLKVYDENLDEVTAKRITGITASTSNQTKTISGLDPCKDYFVTVENVSSGGEYCAAQDPWDSNVETTLGYTITYNTTNISLSSGTEVANSCAADDIDVVYAANDGYHLPTSITVTNAGDENDNWTWDAEDGEFIILDLSAVTGDVEVTISAELDACSDYGFYYGTTKGSENNYECFSQVGTSTTWLTGLWTIPSADQWTYVGTPSWNDSYSANLQLSNMKYALNRSCALGSIGTNVMEGAQGYLRIYSDNTTSGENKYIGFIPAGYVLRWGTDGSGWNSYAFTGESNDIDEEDWNTALQTWTSSNADDFTYVGLKTSSGYVWANRSETRRPVFLKPNDTWKGDNAKFVMYYWDASSHTGYSAIMTDPDGDGIYEAWIPNTYTYTNVIFGRLNPVQVDPVVNWDNKWNKTVDLTLPSDKNLFTITGGSDQSYTGSWSLYDKKGTFHISANSNTNNWYCHFLPHHVLTYNANGGSGAPDVQSVAINASPCQITVAAGSGMTPPTGYSFIGWNPDESEADAGNVDSDYDPNDTPTMSGDITLYAVWQANSIALTLDKSNSDASGSSNGSGSIDYDAASGTITTAATRTGYHVEGYYAEPGCTNKVLEDDGDVINSTVSGYTSSGKWARTTDPTTLYTKWTANTYTISLDDQSATTSASISSITVTFNANTNLTGTVVATRPTKTGYQFGGYYTATSGGGEKIINADGTVVASVATYTDASKNWIKASDVDLYAYWLPIYAITWSVNGSALTGDALDGASTEVVSGGTISGVPSTAPADNTLNNCANKFMGWSRTNITKGSPVTDDDDIAALGLFTEASGYTTAISGATTFYAVFAEQEGGVTATSITSYEDGDYYLIQSFTDSESNTKYVSPTGAASTSVGIVDLTSDVSVSSGVLTLDLTSGSLTNAMVYTLSHESSTYYIYNASAEKYIGSNNSAALTIGKNGWLLLPEDANNKRYMFWRDESTDRCLLYQDTYSNSGTKTSSQIFKCYAKSLAGDISQQSGKECYGSGYFFLVPATGATYTNYVTQCADDQVRVTYDFNGGTGDDCTEGVTEKTANYTVCSTEPEKDYYTFAGWNDGTSTYSAGATGYNLQTNTTFTAQWTATSYDITYVLDGGTNDGDNPATYTVETSDITLKDATKGHSRFDGWFTDNGVWSEEVTTISNGSHGNITLYAKWTDRNEIKFYADASLLATIYRASDENLQASVTGQGSKPSDPSAPSACSSKVFMGWTETWFNDETDTEPADLNDATGTRSADKTYYAVWATQSGSLGSYTYSAYSTTCCANEVTVSGGSPSNGSVTFDKSYVWTCKGEREIEMTIDPADGYQLATFSVATGDGKVTAKSMSADVELNNNSSEPQEITLTFAQDADGAYDVTATFAEMTVTSWEWTYNSSALPDPIDVYVGQKKQIDVVMSPSGVLSSHKNNNSYTHSVNATYIANPNRAGAYFTFEGKAATESTPITLTHNDDTSEPKAFALTFNVRVKALPLVHFVDNIHNESFSDVVATVSGDKMTVNMVQSTPTHVDVAVPGTGNSCEKTHLHLIGWIRSDYSKVAAYMAGTGDAPTTEELSGAGSDYWFLPDADINVETFNGKTFYAVWAKLQ